MPNYVNKKSLIKLKGTVPVPGSYGIIPLFKLSRRSTVLVQFLIEATVIISTRSRHSNLKYEVHSESNVAWLVIQLLMKKFKFSSTPTFINVFAKQFPSATSDVVLSTGFLLPRRDMGPGTHPPPLSSHNSNNDKGEGFRCGTCKNKTFTK